MSRNEKYVNLWEISGAFFWIHQGLSFRGYLPYLTVNEEDRSVFVGYTKSFVNRSFPTWSDRME